MPTSPRPQTPDHALLASLYEEPTPEGLLRRLREEVGWETFEHFVAYVFERAGYLAQHTGLQFGQGIDIKLHTGTLRSKPTACVSVKYHQTEANRVSLAEVTSFNTFVQRAACPFGYLVTNTGFTKPAYDAAMELARLTPLDGEHLARFVAYVRGSRLAGSEAPPIAPGWIFKADALPRRDPAQTRVLAIANNKGGVAKTTTALYLGRRFAERGLRVLLVDLDSQANLTDTLPNPHGTAAQPVTLVDYVARRAQLHQLVRPTHLPRLFVVPAHPDLRLAVAGIKDEPAEELRFAEHLHDGAVRPPAFIDNGSFDWIIIDTPPEMTFRTRAALAAAHYVLAPFEAGPYPASGLQQLLDTMRAIRGLTGTDPTKELRLVGCVVTKWQDTKQNRDLVTKVDDTLLRPNHAALLATRITLDPNIVKDESGQFHVVALGAKPAAVKYTELAEEVLARVNHP